MEALSIALPPAGTEILITPESGKALFLDFPILGVRFERGGSNLYIIAPDGGHITITGYFTHAELMPFYVEDAKLVPGADFLMVMNPLMDIRLSGLSEEIADAKNAQSIFNTSARGLDGNVFYSLVAGEEQLDHGYQAEWMAPASNFSLPDLATGISGEDSLRYWLGGEARQGQTFIQGLDGAVSVTLSAPTGAAIKPFIAYVTMNGEDTAAVEACRMESSECGNYFYQDGPLGRASLCLKTSESGDMLEFAAEGFYSFQAYYEGWLGVNVNEMRVGGAHVLLNTPSGKTVMDMEDFFRSPAFSGIPVSWSYEDGQKLPEELGEYADGGFNLLDLIDAVDIAADLPDANADVNSAGITATHSLHVENVILVHADTNDVLLLAEDWPADSFSNAKKRAFTLDEQTLLIEDDVPLPPDKDNS